MNTYLFINKNVNHLPIFDNILQSYFPNIYTIIGETSVSTSLIEENIKNIQSEIDEKTKKRDELMGPNVSSFSQVLSNEDNIKLDTLDLDIYKLELEKLKLEKLNLEIKKNKNSEEEEEIKIEEQIKIIKERIQYTKQIIEQIIEQIEQYQSDLAGKGDMKYKVSNKVSKMLETRSKPKKKSALKKSKKQKKRRSKVSKKSRTMKKRKYTIKHRSKNIRHHKRKI
jgi:hypothetical protein